MLYEPILSDPTERTGSAFVGRTLRRRRDFVSAAEARESFRYRLPPHAAAH